MARRHYAFTTLLVVAVAVACLSSADAKLTVNYYKKTCPRMEKIISEAVTSKQLSNPTTAAGTLRVFFHDCFVSGCDASTFISSNHFNKAERDADINLSLPGDAFDLVTRAKSTLELECPGIVSCSDILALATRDLISMVGGPFYTVRLGRKDSLTSTASSTDGHLPLTNQTMTEIIGVFQKNGFTVQELVALTGAHTIGFSHCKEYINRIHNYKHGGPNAFDPSMEPRYAKGLQAACAKWKEDPTIATFNDIMTPGKFDNLYFKNLERGLGLLATDQALFEDKRTKPIVQLYASNQTAFFNDFVYAMEKLSRFGVKTGRKGEVRRRCDAFNEIST
ncbi:hypothetical protein LUZ61_004330 [Rhynchospora tenuis]|uniref:Peroxidase n=1 Tax=Rhynchospora tenuis TaxID=198213 RepID=A0AAD5ZMG6_9POAL|nr:hypothetical protein LUZ61_004330 [Rhynchospora tenuis]